MESNSPLGDATIAADLLDDDEADPQFVDDASLPADRFLPGQQSGRCDDPCRQPAQSHGRGPACQR